ncbi:MAG: NAD(+) kinase, partial [Candidatus Oxydemutatoraceae bacterium WSBS_2016_MAG_OTU14]
LIEPTLEATLLVPICPHTLSHRPLIIDAQKTVTIEHTPQNEENALSSIDGQIDIIMQPGDCVVIKTLPTKLKLIQPEQHDYFETLRNKLHWSETL